MKQNLKIGNVVDDGSGDYLRQGGLKINDNFDQLYYQLGDGKNPHAAGAWKTWNAAQGSTLNAEFGHSYTIDTASGRVAVRLPKGTVAEYNFVIRLRDVFSTWQINPVTIIPAVGDTIKGSPNAVEIKRNLADLELVYCAPGRWEYIDNKQVDRISNNDIATVVKAEFIGTQNQTDFLSVFPTHDYNTTNLEVYHRGNLLFYGKNNIFDPVNAEFGSVGPNGTLVPLDGKTVRLRQKCNAGDTVIIVSYMDGLGQWRASYNRRQIRVLDSRYTDRKTINGSVVVADLATKKNFTMVELGVDDSQPVNPNACELTINSILQCEAGTAGLPIFRCEGAQGETADICYNNGGDWIESATDFRYILDDEGIKIVSVEFDTPLEDGDVLGIVWYNNDIGTTLSMDEILSSTDDRYVSSGGYVSITGDVRIIDTHNPFWPNVEPVAPTDFKPSSVAALFNIVHPVGSVYENTVNPNNPATYMGFGTWQRLESTMLVGWSSDPGSRFNLNNNDIDIQGNPTATAGGTGGKANVRLEVGNIPKLTTDDKVLVVDANGPIIVGGCQFDPDSQGPAYTKYREDKTTINKIYEEGAQAVDVMNPYLVVYRWVRTA